MMGKKKGGGNSWLTAMKRAFRSPSKEEHEDKKREKRRWIFRKPAINNETQTPTSQQTPEKKNPDAAETDQKEALAVAVAAAEAAMATAQAAAVVARLTKHHHHHRHHDAATVIQTAFRGYLARRALKALKGLVKLQALVRGHNVRKQAKMTLRCMQALVRVQARVVDQRVRLSHDGSSRKSTFSDTNSLLELRYLQDISDRRSMVSREEGSSIADDWDERPHTVEEIKAMLKKRKEAAIMKRNKSFPHQQILRSGGRPSIGKEEEMEERPIWLDRWMAGKPWQTRARASTDQKIPIKTVEMDTNTTSHHHYSNLVSNHRKSHPNYQYNPHRHSSVASPATPSPAKSRTSAVAQVRSASPRCGREDRNLLPTSSSSSRTPSLRSNYHYTGNSLPNYMAATESTKARIRSQSAPRQRPSTPSDRRDRNNNGSARKRLSFPAPSPSDAYGYGVYGHSLRSPSFKSVCGSQLVLDLQSNYSSCCSEMMSPSSTGDLRRWLR